MAETSWPAHTSLKDVFVGNRQRCVQIILVTRHTIRGFLLDRGASGLPPRQVLFAMHLETAHFNELSLYIASFLKLKGSTSIARNHHEQVREHGQV